MRTNSQRLHQAVLRSLEIDTPTPDLDGLRSIYRAWCLQVPFDNLFKTKALFENPSAPAPFPAPEEFFDRWLSCGTGATCWPSTLALHSLLVGCGFNASLATASMYDTGRESHATVLVHLSDGMNWLVDTSLLSMQPLRIDIGHASHVVDPVHYAEVEITDTDLFVHGTDLPMSHIYFRLMNRNATARDYEWFWIASCGASPFNSRVHIRRNREQSIEVVRGCRLFTLDARGRHIAELDAGQLLFTLEHDMGIEGSFLRQWAASGAFEASTRPESPPPQLPLRTPPSQRARTEAGST